MLKTYSHLDNVTWEIPWEKKYRVYKTDLARQVCG